MDQKTIMVGLLRFSVLTPTYYTERFEALEEIAEHLFSPQRMGLRFHLFENLCLPSLVRQSDPDFQCVVLTARSMPAQYRDRLQNLLDPLPNVHYRAVEPDIHYQLLKAGYNSLPTGDATHRILFRLDDDDAVDLNFVKRTKRLAAVLKKMHRRDKPTIIAYNRGYYVRIQNGENEVFDACERAPLSTGAALLAPVDYPRNPYRFNHRAFGQHFNVYSDISTPGFIRTIHEDNKSSPTQMGLTRKQDPTEMARHISRHFGIDVKDLKAL